MESVVARAQSGDAAELAAVAAATFPLACPPSVPAENIAPFIDANLSGPRFADYLDDPQRVVLAATQGGRIVGYAMLIRSTDDTSVELSKMYVLADRHGCGVSTALMDAALTAAADTGAEQVWLGVNRNNERAQRFYTKSGFTVAGTRSFRLGNHTEHDYVMTRQLR